MHTFSIGQDFMLDGEPVKLISGALHYFRVVPEYWRDRLEKLIAMGCNAVETYLPWNIHEPRKGQFNFAGMADAEAFIRLAGEMGLMVIARPGPYICAEWEFGGLPAWLLKEDGMRLRTTHSSFMGHLEDYFSVLIPRLAALQVDRGGPIILVQVENEYGYYGDDTAYLEANRDMLRRYGITVPLITSDGPNSDSLACGSVEGAHPTANFGSRAEEQSPLLRKFLDSRGGGPEMVMEFWIGWFDHWGNGGHVTADTADNAANLDEILRRGSVNFYMFHGGTNFGFMNGSNYYDELTPDVTSYDYDAPLSEDGRITPKYEALRAVIAKHSPVREIALSGDILRKAYGEAKVSERVSLFRTLGSISAPTASPWPVCMEKLSQNYGYTLYTSRVTKGEMVEKIRLLGANDRANIFANGKQALTLYDRELLEEYPVSWPVGEGLELGILVENMGRVNYGPRMDTQRKGIDGGVLLNSHYHLNWNCYPLELDEKLLGDVNWAAGWQKGEPGFHRFFLEVDEPADTFVDMTGWGKGCLFVNSFNLGRFWERGPQKRLYLPAPLLKEGKNELVVFESDGIVGESIALFDEPDLG